MAYIPTVWATGDVITAEKLNNMEQGIEASVPYWVTFSDDEQSGNVVCDKTYDEVLAAWNAGKFIIGRYGNVVMELQKFTGDSFLFGHVDCYPRTTDLGVQVTFYSLFFDNSGCSYSFDRHIFQAAQS